MGDLIELKDRIAQMAEQQKDSGFEAFLLTEGLDLLAEFRSIEDAGVRTAIATMISKVARAQRSA